MKTVFLTKNPGCSRRALDLARLSAYFSANEFEVVDNPKKADYIIFVTCSFMKSKVDECIKKIKNFRKYNGEVIVLGCLPEIALSSLKKVHEGKYLSTKDIEEIDKYFPDFKIKLKDIPDSNYISSASVPSLKICSGCNDKCSYCAINRAIGELKSKSLKQCKEEYLRLLGNNLYIDITADNVGSYGLDIGSSFGKLLLELDKISPNEIKWQIKELHPFWIIKYKKELLSLIKKGRIVCLQSAIQSGSERILSLMNRYNNLKEIEKTLLEFRLANPSLNLLTQVIVGFPTESEEEFNMTLNSIKQLGFQSVQIFPYYDAENTIASGIKEKVTKRIIKKRMKTAKKFAIKNNIKVLDIPN
ncbi:Ribosomal protein S12 methylthiotransferase RimO [uncultured archaeon]|nr:Ribosomal protein S12 methylthiotransferase RimO [uncultured archaeon]